MSSAFILILSLLACLTFSMVRKVFCTKWEDSDGLRHGLNAAASVVSAVILLAWGGIPSVSWYTVLLGAGFGVVTALQQIATLKAMSIGSWAYTTVITSLSMLIPALSGCLWWGEQLAWAQIIGMALLVICLILSVEKDKDKKALSLRWLLYCALAFVMGGLIGVMQKVHQSSDHKAELNAFLVIAFAVSALYSCLAGGNAMRDEMKKHSKRTMLVMAALGVLGGACCAVNNKLNLHLSGVMDSAVFFPVFNGGNLILTTLLAVVAFREKLTKKQWIGVAIGILSVIFLCNPFG